MSNPAPRTPAPTKNQRRSRRQAPKSCTRIIAYSNAFGFGKNVALQILDVSETGIRLLVKRDLPVGLEFEIKLESAGTNSVKTTATIVWSIQATDGQWVVGASFAKPINYRDLHSLAKM